MRRVAVHRVWVASTRQLLSWQVVEVNERGEAVSCHPFSEETVRTEWWGGLLVLSPVTCRLRRGEPFADFCARTADEVSEALRASETSGVSHVSGIWGTTATENTGPQPTGRAAPSGAALPLRVFRVTPFEVPTLRLLPSSRLLPVRG